MDPAVAELAAEPWVERRQVFHLVIIHRFETVEAIDRLESAHAGSTEPAIPVVEQCMTRELCHRFDYTGRMRLYPLEKKRVLVGKPKAAVFLFGQIPQAR